MCKCLAQSRGPINAGDDDDEEEEETIAEMCIF